MRTFIAFFKVNFGFECFCDFFVFISLTNVSPLFSGENKLIGLVFKFSSVFC